jgi:hypothetical protein
MKEQELRTRFVVCVNNKGYATSLELRKIYQVVEDARSEEHGLIRVIDESGEDYLYPVEYFAAIELPQAVEDVFTLVS